MAETISDEENVIAVSHDLFAHDIDLKNLLNYRQTVKNWVNAETYDWAGRLRLLQSARQVSVSEMT